MDFSSPEPAADRRVRRSRAALIRAAIAVVTERGTAAVSVTDIAEAADVSRPVLYQQFGDRDSLLLEAALDLVRSELLSQRTLVRGRDGTLAVVRHFAVHRVFYRALLTSPSAFALNKGLADLLVPVNRHVVRELYGPRLDENTVDDLATYLTGGAAAFINTWLVEGEDPLDPERFADRLMRVTSVLLDRAAQPAVATKGEEQQ
ncbi:TetR/AcrR family transcriptional regulator [Nocardia sp. NBC_00565]|uniref:TetR/AcrR family transcriptional regulator n=1 Tax=Nocardia sp. NBC_00565 TaxID=2975993 RepID=UPI002E805B59|nr:helix-turn-helix domain-containing protein [Nocardia sp. NBC_00565]WUC04996.1 TetR/AcrR family transcriptional regulator [Nocardia sp. NBC_00565]